MRQANRCLAPSPHPHLTPPADPPPLLPAPSCTLRHRLPRSGLSPCESVHACVTSPAPHDDETAKQDANRR